MITLMIVDDDADDRKIFCEVAYDVNPEIKCIEATGGEEALAYLSNPDAARPDVIFLDVNMPRMNGIQCLEEIKKNEELADISVAVYTTTINTAHERKAKILGANYFFSKPAFFNEICKIISHVLENELAERKQDVNSRQ